jgi:tripartite-type tricarboxylate transporter receptor subunit TctC
LTRTLKSFLLLAGALALAGAARAQTFPDKPIHFIVPFGAGTVTDQYARAIAAGVTEITGQPVVIDNRAGASGFIGTQQAAKASPDGYTVLIATNTTHAANEHLFKKLPYDPVKDFAPIGLTAWGTLVLVAHPDQKPGTLAELVAAAKAAPRTINYGSPGVGTPHHLAMALIETDTGIELVHVPYKGSAGALQDLLGGQIPYMFLPVHVAATYIKSGKLKALAIGSPKRHVLLPEVPTLIEQGLKDADVDMWYGLFAPKRTPRDVIVRLNRELVAILESDEALGDFGKQGLVPATSTPSALGDIVERDRDRWAAIVKKRGIKAE